MHKTSISRADALLLISKFVTEATKVSALWFDDAARVSFSVTGLITSSDTADGGLQLTGDGGTAFLYVALDDDCSFEYADDRAHPELLKFSSGIRITFRSGAVLFLMEPK